MWITRNTAPTMRRIPTGIQIPRIKPVLFFFEGDDGSPGVVVGCGDSVPDDSVPDGGTSDDCVTDGGTSDDCVSEKKEN